MRAWRGRRSPSLRTGRWQIAPAASIASTTAGPSPPAAPVITTCRSTRSMARMIAPASADGPPTISLRRALLAAIEGRRVDAEDLRPPGLAAAHPLQYAVDV